MPAEDTCQPECQFGPLKCVSDNNMYGVRARSSLHSRSNFRLGRCGVLRGRAAAGSTGSRLAT